MKAYAKRLAVVLVGLGIPLTLVGAQEGQDNVFVSRPFTVSSNTDNIVSRPFTVTSNTDSIVSRAVTVTSNTEGIVSRAFTATSNTGGIVSRAFTATSNTEGIVSRAFTATSNTEGIVSRAFTATSNTDRIVSRAFTAVNCEMGVDGLCADCDADGIPDECEIDCGEEGGPCDLPGCGESEDCNSNGLPDECELADCRGDPACSDCNDNGILDECDILDGTSEDCNDNGRPDECEIRRERGEGFFCDVNCDDDCNDNGIPDECDIAGGESEDCDGNGVPDECQPDCNENGIADACDIINGTSEDCNDNGRPDECEIPRDFGEGFFCDEDCDPDCNENGVPDECDIADGTSEDCNGNGIPDSCDLAACEDDPGCDDCNGNGILDSCDIAACEGTPPCSDCNNNGVPDGCDIERGNSEDDDEDGVPDECIAWDDEGGDRLWGTAANWEGNRVPGEESEDVDSPIIEMIDGGAANVLLDIDVSVDSLVLGPETSLDIATGDLTIDAPNGINNSGDLTVRDGRAIRATSAMTISGIEPIVLAGDSAAISSNLAEHVVTNLGTVTGRGRFSAALLNLGIIRADDPAGALVIADAMFPKTNQGILRADADGRLVIETNISGAGNLATEGGVISIPSLDQAVTVSGGSLTIEDVDMLGGSGLEVDNDTSVLLSGDVLIVRGRYGPAPGAENVSAFLSARSVIIQGDVDRVQPGEMDLIGDMRVDVEQDLLLNGTGTGPCGQGVYGNDTPPILRTSGRVRINVERSVRFVESVEVLIGEQAVMSAGGDFDNRSIWAVCFDWPGTLELDGAELQRFEVAGEDRGADLAGFDENFAMGTLELAPNATVRLTDGFDNQNDDGGPCDEVLYVDTLIVGEGATIEETSCTLYYRVLDNRGGNLPGLGTRILRICVRDPEWLCDGDVDGDGQVNPVDSGLVQAAFGSEDESDLCQYDVDCDGQINPVDSGIVQSLFGTCEEPREVCP